MKSDRFKGFAEQFPGIKYALSGGCYDSGPSRREIEDLESVKVRYLDEEVPPFLECDGTQSEGVLVNHEETETVVFVVRHDNYIEELKEVVGSDHYYGNYHPAPRDGKPLREVLLGYTGFRYVVVLETERRWSEPSYMHFQGVDGSFDFEGFKAVELPQPSLEHRLTVYRPPRDGKWDKLYGPEVKRIHADPVSDSFRNGLKGLKALVS